MLNEPSRTLSTKVVASRERSVSGNLLKRLGSHTSNTFKRAPSNLNIDLNEIHISKSRLFDQGSEPYLEVDSYHQDLIQNRKDEKFLSLDVSKIKTQQTVQTVTSTDLIIQEEVATCHVPISINSPYNKVER